MDSADNVVLSGSFRSATVDFGGGPLINAGERDIFMAKYDSSGQHLWSKSFGGESTDRGEGIAVDSTGNVLLTGYFGDTVDFGGGPLTSAGSGDILMAKYDSSGQHLWSKRFGGGFLDQGGDVVADAAGNVLVTGMFQVTADFGGVPLTSAGGSDIFVAKYDPSGQHLWSNRFGGTSFDGFAGTVYSSIAADAAGNVLMAGIFQLTADFGGGPLTSGGYEDVFVAKYDSSGQHLWSKRLGDGGRDLVYDVAVDAAGNVLVAGRFEGTVDFGGGPLTSAGNEFDIFLAKYDASGQHLWSKRFGDAQLDGSRSVGVDSAGNVLLTGHFTGTVDFGGGPLTSAGDPGVQDMFIAKFDASGQHLWSNRFGNSDAGDYGNSVRADSAGNLLLTGIFRSTTVDFGGGPLTNAGNEFDIFLAKLAP